MPTPDRPVYAAMSKINFEGMHYRRDIAHQAVTVR